MCFFLYSPNNTLSLDYISETIFLHDDGSSQVVIDILLNVIGQSEINQIYCLYPNRFSIVDEKTESFVDIGEWEDISHTFYDDDDLSNWVYALPGSALIKNSLPPDGRFEVEEHDVPVEIRAPNPRNPEQHLSYYGVISGNVSMETVDGLEPIEWAILQELAFTPFTVNFDVPLTPGKPRWLRWHFSNASCAVNDPLSKKEFRLRKFMDRIYYNYDIYGPFDVRRRFLNFLRGYELECQRKKKLSHHGPYVSGLIRKLYTNGVSDKISTTYAPDWRIHVIPVSNKLSRLTDFDRDGHVEIMGGLPNFVTLNLEGVEKRYPVYEWKAGAISEIEEAKAAFAEVDDDDEVDDGHEVGVEEWLEYLRQRPYYFSIKFQAKLMSNILPWIPWASLVIAVLGIIIGIIAIFK